MRKAILLAVALVLAMVVGLTITCLPVQAETKVDLELVLLADASGSIDSTELAFQRQGYADALVHPEVQRAISSGAYRRIALTYVEWGNDQWQDVVVPWTIIDGLASAQAFGATLMQHPRRAHGGNAIGSALAAATRLIEGNDIKGERKVIDLSGDSANSWSGMPIPVARAEALAHGIVINGLAIACRDQGCSGRPMLYNLEDAFERDIIGGPGSFVVTADSSTSFEDAVRKKLILEISLAPAGEGVRLARRP